MHPTYDVSISLHLVVSLGQLERLVITLRDHKELYRWRVVIQSLEKSEIIPAGSMYVIYISKLIL